MTSNSTATPNLSTQRVASGLDQPLYVTAPTGDPNRLFIVEQKSGAIKILDLQSGSVLAQPFLTIPSSELLKNGFEQGMLGLAFHPNYATNGKFYVSYTAPFGGRAGQTKVVEYQVSANNPNLADPNPARTILTINQPQENHNGGWLAFGKDGYLYWSSGDGGGSGYRPGIPTSSDNSQDITNNLLGKILRLDVNGDAFENDPTRNYAIPSNNPFVGKEGDDEIWAYGLRNPWRPSFDRLTGDLYIADVGQGEREEINFQSASSQGGQNYGWNLLEGTLPHKPGVIPPNVVAPIYEYDHTIGRSVTGGYVYRGSASELNGTYFFGDFSTSKIWSFRYNGSTVTEFSDRTEQLKPNLGAIDNIASFGEDASGNLYIVDLDGEIFRLVVDDNTDNTIRGSDGNDNLKGTDSDDIIDGLGGNDKLRGQAGNDQLIGNLGNDTLLGEAGNDTLLGGLGNDRLLGNGGDDVLLGDEGNDTLLGGLGSDTLTGGANSDRFVFNTNAAYNSATSGTDIITDFVSGTDKIVLDKTTFQSLRSLSFESVASVDIAQTSSALITYIQATGSLFYNQNGETAGFGTGSQFADLTDGRLLTASDFVVQA